MSEDRVTTCDRCGATTTERSPTIGEGLTGRRAWTGLHGEVKADLCNGCSRELKEWIGEGGEPKPPPSFLQRIGVYR